MLKNAQILGFQQKLSPQLIQSQLLLAVPTLVLENEIKTQLESNPILEEVIDGDDELAKEEDIISDQTFEDL
ncbi:MAG: RNA polymerase factor sigma-54, partial [Ignavibacteria bacterium]